MRLLKQVRGPAVLLASLHEISPGSSSDLVARGANAAPLSRCGD